MQACNGAERPGRTQHASTSPFQCSPPMKQPQAQPAEELSIKYTQAPPLEELSPSDSEGSNASACLCSPTPGSMQSVQSPAGQDLRSVDSPPPSPTVIQAQRPEVPRLFVPGSFAGFAAAPPTLTPTSKARQPLHQSARPSSAASSKSPWRPWSELFGLTSRPLERHSHCGKASLSLGAAKLQTHLALQDFAAGEISVCGDHQMSLVSSRSPVQFEKSEERRTFGSTQLHGVGHEVCLKHCKCHLRPVTGVWHYLS